LLQPNVGKIFEVRELIEKVETNLLVSGVSITGGEPSLQVDLLELCKEIKKLGKYLSIDTNGSDPEVIKELLPYIDRVALDVKAPFDKEKIEKVTKVKIDPNKIIKTITLVNNQKNVEFEIRTTYVENLLTPLDIREIISFLKENAFRGNYVLQQYQYSEGVGTEFKDMFKKPEHGTLLNILKFYKDANLPFNLFIRDDIIGYSDVFNLFEFKIDDV